MQNCLFGSSFNITFNITVEWHIRGPPKQITNCYWWSYSRESYGCWNMVAVSWLPSWSRCGIMALFATSVCYIDRDINNHLVLCLHCPCIMLYIPLNKCIWDGCVLILCLKNGLRVGIYMKWINEYDFSLWCLTFFLNVYPWVNARKT